MNNQFWSKMFTNLCNESPRKKVETGALLLEKIFDRNGKLLINEDIQLLKNAFQSELQLFNDIENVDRFSTNEYPVSIAGAVLVLIIALASNVFYFNYHTVFIIFCLTLFAFSILLYLYQKRSFTKKFFVKFNVLIETFQKEKGLYKKLLQLIEDSETRAKHFNSLTTPFGNISRECFQFVRKISCSIVSEFSFKTEIVENLICQLPDDLFETCNHDEITPKNLRSLKHLVSLQISELFKCLFFVFIQNYYKVPSKFNQDFYHYIQNNVITPMLVESHKRQKELLAIIYYHKSLYELEVPYERIALDSKSPSNLWPVCRNIRKNLFAALSIIDNFEEILQTDAEITPDKKLILENRIELLNNEIYCIQESSRSFLKTISFKANPAHESKQQETHQMEDVNCNKRAVETENYIAQDEVLEAYVPYTSDNCDIHEDLSDMVDSVQVEASNNIYQELKHALKNKAIEHKIREAKVLGLTVDEKKFEEEYEETVIKKGSRELNECASKPKPIQTEVTPTETIRESSIPNGFGFSFNLDLELKDKERMRLFLNVNEDTFECDADEPQSDTDS